MLRVPNEPSSVMVASTVMVSPAVNTDPATGLMIVITAGSSSIFLQEEESTSKTLIASNSFKKDFIFDDTELKNQ